MENTKEFAIKSGADVINEFFAEIHKIENADEDIVKALVGLHREGKFKATPIQNAMDELINRAVDKIGDPDEKN